MDSHVAAFSQVALLPGQDWLCLVASQEIHRGNPTIAMVGAGIAGLNCALILADKGLRPSVYEASGRTGGRIFPTTKDIGPMAR